MKKHDGKGFCSVKTIKKHDGSCKGFQGLLSGRLFLKLKILFRKEPDFEGCIR